MAFKVNYNQQRAERDRAKAAKKEAKLREQEELTARRKAGLDNPEPAGADMTGVDESGGTLPADGQAGSAQPAGKAGSSDGAA